MLFLAKLKKEAVTKVGQQMRRHDGGGNGGTCQRPEKTVIAKAPQHFAASSHVKVGGEKSSGLQDGQEVPEKWPHHSSIGKENKVFTAGLGEEGVEHHSTNPHQ